MNLSNLIFIDRYPSIDLHGFDYDTAKVEVKDFIIDLVKMKQEIGVIVHGIGGGVMKKATLEVLKNNKNVIDYKIAYNNPGCTIVRILI